ncbi:MAG TPA: aldo/keto reductase, partial [Actinomycetota bacterium]|nr:aldo/keto reductase [Actinomycetota bacterium]
MRKVRLGAQGPEVSSIGYGAWEAGGDFWGPNDSDEQVVSAIRAGLEAGINWIDTAEVYGNGESERLVGKAVEGWTGIRIATKVAPRPSGTGFRAAEVRRACEESLRRLGRDTIDLYQLHWRDPRVQVEETWTAMAQLVEDGLVGAIGVSNFDEDLIERCLAVRHVDSLQPQLSMLHLRHRELAAWCGERGIGVITYGPLGYGLLTGGIRSREDLDPGDWRRNSPGHSYFDAMFAPGKLERSLEVVDRLRGVADRLGVTVAQLSLAWNVHQQGVTAAIAGSRNPEHVRQNAAAGELELDGPTLQELEQILQLGPDFA